MFVVGAHHLGDALARAINQALGNVGTTVFYTAPIVASPRDGAASIADLVVSAGLMSADEVARVLSPERLSGMAPVTGVIALPVMPPPLPEP